MSVSAINASMARPFSPAVQTAPAFEGALAPALPAPAIVAVARFAFGDCADHETFQKYQGLTRVDHRFHRAISQDRQVWVEKAAISAAIRDSKAFLALLKTSECGSPEFLRHRAADWAAHRHAFASLCGQLVHLPPTHRTAVLDAMRRHPCFGFLAQSFTPEGWRALSAEQELSIVGGVGALLACQYRKNAEAEEGCAAAASAEHLAENLAMLSPTARPCFVQAFLDGCETQSAFRPRPATLLPALHLLPDEQQASVVAWCFRDTTRLTRFCRVKSEAETAQAIRAAMQMLAAPQRADLMARWPGLRP